MVGFVCIAAEQMRVLRQVTRRQGKYVAGVEAAIQHVNDQIEEVQARKAFISCYQQQDPMHARQQMEQQQLFDLGMDVGLQAARRAVGKGSPKCTALPTLLRVRMGCLGDCTLWIRCDSIACLNLETSGCLLLLFFHCS